MTSILIAEDDTALAHALMELLTEDGYQVDVCERGDDALIHAQEHPYDVILLDVMLPGMDGFAVVAALRSSGQTVPVLMLTARDSVDDRVKGLNAGADDYLVKPFAAIELTARLHALLRRPGTEFGDPHRLSIGDAVYDTKARELLIAGELIVLPPKEGALLELLLRHPNQVLTREQIMARLWGYEGEVLENTLETYVSKLRKRLESGGCPGCPVIQTVRGLGYRLQTES